MSQPCTVVIAAPDRFPGLKKRAGDGKGEVLLFSEADALLALEAITERRPRVVTLERLFAETPRGVALINRIKADPALVQSEIRVVSHDDPDGAHVLSQQGGALPSPAAGGAIAAAPLDQRGTRRAPRFPIAPHVNVQVDGNTATLVNLSIIGAQVLSKVVLRPKQRVRMTLSDEAGVVRFKAVVAWATFEMPSGSGPRYRAGIEFADANPAEVDAYCSRHRVS